MTVLVWLTWLVLLLEWKASKYVAYLDYYCDYDAYSMRAHFDSLDVNRAKIVDTHDVTIAETMDAPMFLYIFQSIVSFVRIISVGPVLFCFFFSSVVNGDIPSDSKNCIQHDTRLRLRGNI